MSRMVPKDENVVEETKCNKTMRFYQAGEVTGHDAKMPLQLRQIMNFLVSTGFKGTGTQIIEEMIKQGLIVTKQNPAVLFAFYARRLETMGIARS